MSDESKPKSVKRSAESKAPRKEKRSKFGRMIGSCKGKIIEVGEDIWDLKIKYE